MAINIDVPSTFISESESYEWYDGSGIALKDIKTVFFQTTAPSGWVDISDYVRSIRITAAVANTMGEPCSNNAVVELDNYDKRFTDINTASPYYGNINPNLHVRIDVSIGSTLTTLFTGRVSQQGFVEQKQGQTDTVTINVMDDAYGFMRKKFDKDYYYTDKILVNNADAANSLLNILLETHGGLAHSLICTNGAVMVTVPYTVFREGESVQDHIREVAKAGLAQYCGFRHDGKYVFESRMIDGWSEPSAEYVLTAESYAIDLTKEIVPLIGNNVKVRGVNDFAKTNIVLWDLSKIKEVGTNANYPHDCYEKVESGNFYLGTPTEPYWAEYTSNLGEILYTTSHAISIKRRAPLAVTWAEGAFDTSQSDFDAEPTRGSLVIQSSSAITQYVMQMIIKGNAVIRHKFSHKNTMPSLSARDFYGLGMTATNYGSAIGWAIGTGAQWTGDDEEWGRIGVQSNASSIAQYGQTDCVVSSEYIVCNTQLDNVLQWHLLNGKDPKHLFVASGLPFLAFMQPGSPMWLNLTDLGFSGMVTVQGFDHNITPDGADTTLTLLENPGDWLVSTGATVRTMAPAGSGGIGAGEIGPPAWGGNNVYTIGPNGCSQPADTICDGVADEDEIIGAIQNGHLHILLLAGDYNISSMISVAANVDIGGSGPGTNLLLATPATYVFNIQGNSAPSKISNIKIHDMTITDNITSTTTATYAIYGNFSEDIEISDMILKGMGDAGIAFYDSSRPVIRNNIIYGDNLTGKKLNVAGILVYDTDEATIDSNRIIGLRNANGTAGDFCAGIIVDGNDCAITNNLVSDILVSAPSGAQAWGIWVGAANRAHVANNRINTVKLNVSFSGARGIFNQGVQTIVASNFCNNNGLDTDITNANDCNFYDVGTSTMANINSWQ